MSEKAKGLDHGMSFNVGPQFTFPILGSKALADKTVICIASGGDAA